VRALTAVLLALALLIPLIGTAYAQDDPGADWPPYYGNNRICVVGRVINFDETPLPYSDIYTSDDPSESWVITATRTSDGYTIPVSLDKDGFFILDEEDGLTVGQWTIAITLPLGWEPVDPYATTLTLNLDYGMKECAKVRFKLRWPVNVIVLKIDDKHVPLEGWTIRAEPVWGNWFASPVEEKTNAQGITEPFRLTAGKWTFTERAPKDTHFKPVMPESGQQELNVDPRDANGDPGYTYELRFKNRIYNKGCIVVHKQDAWPVEDPTDFFGLPGWTMTVKRLDGTVVASGVTDALGDVKFDHLYFGPYIVTEEQKPGWASNYATSVQVNVAPPTGEGDDCTPVTFTNIQSAGFCIEGYKLDANGHVGIPNWTFTAVPLSKGGYPNPHVDKDAAGVAMSGKLTTTTDATGHFVFDASMFPENDYRIPIRKVALGGLQLYRNQLGQQFGSERIAEDLLAFSSETQEGVEALWRALLGATDGPPQ